MGTQDRTVTYFHFVLHLVIGTLAGAFIPTIEGAALWGGGGVAHLEGSHLFKKYVMGEEGDPMHDWQNIIVRGAGLVIGLGIGRLIRSGFTG